MTEKNCPFKFIPCEKSACKAWKITERNEDGTVKDRSCVLLPKLED